MQNWLKTNKQNNKFRPKIAILHPIYPIIKKEASVEITNVEFVIKQAIIKTPKPNEFAE